MKITRPERKQGSAFLITLKHFTIASACRRGSDIYLQMILKTQEKQRKFSLLRVQSIGWGHSQAVLFFTRVAVFNMPVRAIGTC
jgi:hypothetical protein